MIHYLHKSCLLLFVTALYTFSHVAYADSVISFSRYRLPLDDKNRNTSLTVYNQGTSNSRCTLGFSHNKVLPNGETTRVKSADEIFNSADHFVRYSPRRVTIPASGSQTVRLSMKRVKNQADGEYVSYLKLSCRSLDTPVVKGTASVTPGFTYNIPIVARVGELEATATLSDPVVKGSYLHLKINRQGNRSLYGDVVVTDSTNKVVGTVRKVAVFPPADYRQVQVKLTTQPQGKMSITFEEAKSYGGNVKATL